MGIVGDILATEVDAPSSEPFGELGVEELVGVESVGACVWGGVGECGGEASAAVELEVGVELPGLEWGLVGEGDEGFISGGQWSALPMVVEE